MIKDKVTLITGARSGIGYATAIALSKMGSKIVAGARRLEKLENLKKEVESQGGEIIIQKLDVTSQEDCKNFANIAISKLDRIDILINNAGLMPLSFFKNQKIDEWDRMIDVKKIGSF